jgi:hypothetical protein
MAALATEEHRAEEQLQMLLEVLKPLWNAPRSQGYEMSDGRNLLVLSWQFRFVVVSGVRQRPHLKAERIGRYHCWLEHGKTHGRFR